MLASPLKQCSTVAATAFSSVASSLLPSGLQEHGYLLSDGAPCGLGPGAWLGHCGRVHALGLAVLRSVQLAMVRMTVAAKGV